MSGSRSQAVQQEDGGAARAWPLLGVGAAIFAAGAPLGHATPALVFFMLALPWIWRGVRDQNPGESALGALGAPLAAFVAASLLAALLGRGLQAGLLHTAGLALMGVTGIVAGRAVGMRPDLARRWVLPLIVVSVAAAAAIALHQYYGLGMRRAVGGTQMTNRMGALFAFFGVLGAGYFVHLRGGWRWAAVPFAALTAAGLSATVSRAGWAAAATGAVLLCLRGGRKGLLALLIVAVAAASLFYAEPRWWNRLQTAADINRNMSRLAMWSAALEMWRDHPWTGIGPGSFSAVRPEYMQRGRDHATPHNVVLSILAEMGLIGIAAFAWLLARAARKAAALWRRGGWLGAGLAAALAAIFVNDLFGQGFYTTQIGFVMWFGLGWAAGFPQPPFISAARRRAESTGYAGAPASVSFIVPVRNRAGYIAPCLESLAEAARAAQRALPGGAQIVVIDDASDDGTPQAVREFAAARQQENLTIRVIELESRRGPSRARNAGLAAASGELIVFVDSDIIVEKDFLLSHLAVHTEREVFAAGRLISVPSLEAAFRKPAATAWDYSGATLDTANASARKADLDAVGGFDEGFEGMGWMDLDLGLRLRRRGLKRRPAPDAVGYHVQPPIRTPEQLEARLNKERERGRSAVHFMKQHPGWRARLAAQDTALHRFLNWAFRWGGLVHKGNVLRWVERARRLRLTFFEKVWLAGVINQAHLESLAAAKRESGARR